jgi:threonine aldolase
MASTEAVVFFNKALAREFDARVKQSGQLASKMRFAGAQWAAMLSDGAWISNGHHANAMARKLAEGLRKIEGIRTLIEPEVNAVFVELAPRIAAALESRGWHFYRFIGENGYRFMCSWRTSEPEVDRLLADFQAAATA